MVQSFFKQFLKLKLTKNAVFILIFSAAIIAIFISVTNVNFDKNSRTPSWKNIRDNVPSSLVKKVLSGQSMRQVDLKLIKVMQIPSNGKGKLYIFDFRAAKLCGNLGCFYQVYHESGQLLWQFIANPHLPPKENLIQVSDVVNQDFPCLVVTQSTESENMVSRTLYCYQDGRYTRFNQALTAVGVDFIWSQKGR
jgi:hypothetical protein